tara:strand:- start:6238 stop:8568 length:2331 start_codon:yes stop_codon:yes gene_type:complete
MIFTGSEPGSNDTTARLPINEWKDTYKEINVDVPHWYPHLFSGMPSHGSYISTYYGPVIGFFTSHLFNRGARFSIFFSLSGLGIYFLLRRKSVKKLPALFGGLISAVTPYMFGLINAGHGAKIIALAFVPWVLLAVEYCIENRTWKSILVLALAFGIQLWSNHPQVVYYTWIVVVFRLLWVLIRDLWNSSKSKLNTAKPIAFSIAGLIIAIFMVLDPYVSVYEFQEHSTRGAKSVLEENGTKEQGVSDWDYATAWSMHPKESITFIYPYFYGLQNFPTRDLKSQAYWGYMPFTQSTHYLGLLAVLIAILGLILRKPDEFQVFLWVTGALILIAGFGKYIPILFSPLYHWAPLFAKFRVPSMIYALLPYIIGMLAAYGLHSILHILSEPDAGSTARLKKYTLLVFGSFLGVTLLFLLFGSSMASFMKSGDMTNFGPQIMNQLKTVRIDLFQKGLLLAMFLTAACGISIIMAWNKKLPSVMLSCIVIVLSLIEFWIIDNEFLHLKTPVNIKRQFRPKEVTGFLSKDNELFRIYPVDDFGTNWYGYFGISSIGGYRPVKLRTYQDLMDAGGLNNIPVLNMLNVKYLLTKRDIKLPGFELAFSGNQKIYRNLNVLPKAWFVGNVTSVETQKESLVKTLEQLFDPGKEAIVVNYDGPEMTFSEGGNAVEEEFSENEIILKSNNSNEGLLVLSEMYYAPGWMAEVDGQPAKIYQTNHVLRSVYVPAGEHKVRFHYDDKRYNMIRIISRASFFLVITSIVYIYRRKIVGKVGSLTSKRFGKSI